MRLMTMILVAAFFTAPLVGCENHTKSTDSKNGLTGGESHTTETSTDTH